MNERDELVEQVTEGFVAGVWLDANPGEKTVAVVRDVSEDIIALVRADERRRIREVIEGMRKSAMENHDYGLPTSPTRMKDRAYREVLIETGIADDALVAEEAAERDEIRKMFAAAGLTEDKR